MTQSSLAPRRHDLVWLTPAAQVRIAKRLEALGEESPLYAQRATASAYIARTPGIPGIVRRRAPCDQMPISVGFSFPLRVADQRLRYADTVLESEIASIQTPWHIAHSRAWHTLACAPALHALDALLKPHATGAWGLYGASALQAVTELPYVDRQSDVDVVLRGLSLPTLRHVASGIEEITQKYAVRLDIEVILQEVWGAKLKELISRQKTVLVKSIDQVEILTMNDPIICGTEVNCHNNMLDS